MCVTVRTTSATKQPVASVAPKLAPIKYCVTFSVNLKQKHHTKKLTRYDIKIPVVSCGRPRARGENAQWIDRTYPYIL